MEELFNLKDTITEYRHILGTMLRRGALVFQGGTTKLSDAMAAQFPILRLAIFGALAVFTCKMIQTYGVTLFDGTAIDEILRPVPAECANLLVVIVLVGGYLFHIFGKLERRFRQKDIRLPNTSTPSGGR